MTRDTIGSIDPNALKIPARRAEEYLTRDGSSPFSAEPRHTAKETLWGAVNAVTYYVDHVRGASAGERLDSVWFGAGYALKQKAWAKAHDLTS